MKTFFTFIALTFLSFTAFAVDHISGTLGACVGSSSRLIDSLFRTGTWSSSNILIATVDTGGVVRGVAPGTATITYTHSSTVLTVTFLVSPAPAPITGTTTICAGSTTLLSDATSGGTWSCGGDASITSGGLVTADAYAGTALVYYTIGISCSTSTYLTISGFPYDSIRGPYFVYTCGTITLTYGTGGGAWSSSNTAIATVSSSGVVSGISAGVDTIFYTLTGSCGSLTVKRAITVIGASSAGTISGAPYIYVSGSTTLTDGVTGGSWTSSNTAVATVGASTGIVTGVATGTAIMTYTVPTCSGSVSTTFVITVTPYDEISGHVVFSGGYSGAVKVWLIYFDPGSLMLTAIDSTIVSCSGDSVFYSFMGHATDSFRIKAWAMYDSIGAGYVPTYHTSYAHWHDATVLYHTSGISDYYQTINMGSGTVTSGPGFIGGSVLSGADRGSSGSTPAAGLLILALDSTGALVQQAYTDATGHYSFSNLPLGNYTVYPELLNYTTTPYVDIKLTSGATSASAGFLQHTVSHTITPVRLVCCTFQPAGSYVLALPNPTSGTVNIVWHETSAESAELTLSDIKGSEIKRTTINRPQGVSTTNMDLSGFADGLYIINIKSGNINYNNKIEIRH